jgi:hypothetical protein
VADDAAAALLPTVVQFRALAVASDMRSHAQLLALLPVAGLVVAGYGGTTTPLNPQQTVAAFGQALERHDGAAACALLAPSVQPQVVAVVNQLRGTQVGRVLFKIPRSAITNCTAAADMLFAPQSQSATAKAVDALFYMMRCFITQRI